MTNRYFTIFSNDSQHGCGLKPQVGWMPEETILNCAADEISRAGKSFEEIAGIPLVENENGDYYYGRKLTDKEIFELSVQKLDDDGRLFRVFPTNVTGAADFIKAAGFYGLQIEAAEVVRMYDN